MKLSELIEKLISINSNLSGPNQEIATVKVIDMMASTKNNTLLDFEITDVNLDENHMIVYLET